MSTMSWLRDRIENKVGRPILDNYCKKKYGPPCPIMMPPLPASKFIDKIPEYIELKGANIQEKEHQDAYEAEVKVYRCIEEMKGHYVVIHQFEYTHEQYSAFLPNHQCKKTKKQTREIEGECDFVVVGNQFVAVLEVKGLSMQHTVDDSKRIKGCCNSAQKQRTRTSDLVKSIEPSMMVYEFTVFPNISMEEVEQQYLCDETILFSEDLDNFEHIVRSCETFASLPVTGTVVKSARDKLCCCLLGLWCIDQQNKWKQWQLDICSLSYCIIDISKKLRRALVTRKLIDEDNHNACSKKKKGKEKKYPENPEIVVAPELFKHHLNINCLTKHQLDVFNSNERFLWVDGPAGTGKTIAMLGKIIDLALNTPPEKRILLMMSGCEIAPIVSNHMKLLNNIRHDITCELILYDYEEGHITDQSNKAYRSLLQQMSKCKSKIVLLVFSKCFFKSDDYFLTSFDSIFVDDYQLIVDNINMDIDVILDNDIISKGLLPILKDSDKSDTSVWIFCDEAQSFIEKVFHLRHSRSRCIVNNNMDNFKRYFVNSKLKLSINLRNTYEISTVLTIIRRIYEEIDYTGSATWSVNLPQQVGGHFLRGTKPIIHLLKDDHPLFWKDILHKEIEKLRGPGGHLINKDIAVLLTLDEDDSNLAGRHVLSVTGTWDNTDDELTVRVTRTSMSAEWPAVIFVIRFKHFTDTYNTGMKVNVTSVIPALYMAISRARVYSTVIFYNYKRNICKNTDKLIDELKQRGDVCRVIEH